MLSLSKDLLSSDSITFEKSTNDFLWLRKKNYIHFLKVLRGDLITQTRKESKI